MRWLVVLFALAPGACQEKPAPPPPRGKVLEGPIETEKLPPVVTDDRDSGRGGPRPGSAGRGGGAEGDALSKIGRVLHDNAGVFQGCHDRYFEGATTVTVDFTVDVEGHASGMHGTDGNAEVRACIERVIGALTYPKGGHAVDVSFPFSFQ
jgi:hypothetical protein